MQAALLARGRTVRQAKLQFYAKLAEKALATYERDGWGEFPTQIVPERREIRPTADRGPILLCVDTSGSMRGPREIVAKALALECMRAAKAQERGCYVFAFSGPAEVTSQHTRVGWLTWPLAMFSLVRGAFSSRTMPARICRWERSRSSGALAQSFRSAPLSVKTRLWCDGRCGNWS